MSIFKCKMCGGTIEFIEGSSVGLCDSCGTKQTLPKTNDETVANLFNRANNLRLKCEFDKSLNVYEKIVEQDDSEAEAHWGIVLCKYGIEYVEDPKTNKRVPTCHRTLLEPIATDVDYIAAIDYSDTTQQSIYESEAREIDKIQKGILDIVRNEKPFDIFICYKETDENGRRTIDSTISNDIYYQLTNEGFKVFYAPITLEGKLGQEYEPYIFAALNSAKVMLVVGTKPEYFTSVWVKNEWSRFLNFMKSDRSKLLIPCYKDMDAYELPEEFSHLQAQDMSKIGFINDVVRGIKKVVSKGEPKEKVTIETVGANNNAKPMLERAFMFLEDGKWNDANEYAERVLDIEPKNANAYLVKLLAKLELSRKENLEKLNATFENEENYVKVSKFADVDLAKELEGYIEHIENRNREMLLAKTYAAGIESMQNKNYEVAAKLFESLEDYKDSKELAIRCRNEESYSKAISKMDNKNIVNYEEAIEILKTIDSYKDSNEKIGECRAKIEELKANEERYEFQKEQNRKKRKKIISITSPIICIIVIVLVVLKTIIMPNAKYKDAINLIEEKDYENAYKLFESLGDYKDSFDMAIETKYNYAIDLLNKDDYKSAVALLIELGEYKDCMERIEACEFELLQTTEIGDIIPFGNDNGSILWHVLDVQDKRILVVSEYGIKMCSASQAREWMRTFYIMAFSNNEQQNIERTLVHYYYPSIGDRCFEDKLFSLSTPELKQYFKDEDARKCFASQGAINEGAIVDENGICSYWLRDGGHNGSDMGYIGPDGNIGSRAGSYPNYCIRPAMWISIDSIE